MNKKIKYIYDPLDLIELIEQKPCLWDKTSDDYKDRVKKRNAWDEVLHLLIENYDNLGENEKLQAGKAVTEKWKHIRDAFALSLRKRSGDKNKKYIYYDQLQFLTKILAKNDNISSIVGNDKIEVITTEESDFNLVSNLTSSGSRKRSHTINVIDIDLLKGSENNKYAEIDEESNFNLASNQTSSGLRKRSHTSTMNAVDMALLKVLAKPPTLAEIDEDAGFFASITPFVKKFNEDEKLSFRMGVMDLIQQIRSQDTTSDPSMSS